MPVYALLCPERKALQMTPKQAYRMGFRHVTDLAEINRVADTYLENECDPGALALIEAWRQGAMTATAMLEKELATIQ